MFINNKIYMEDIDINVYSKMIDWKLLINKKIFITGGTGLIGKLLINTILKASKVYNLNCTIIALVRNTDKAKKIFEEQLKEKSNLVFYKGDINDEIKYDNNVDFVIHAASQTASKSFVEDPIGTTNIILNGTRNTLEFSKKNNVKNYIFLSTMEVYGTPTNDCKIDELKENTLKSYDVRNCYPISKFMAENMCFSYSKQFGFNINILRLTQTFGAGVKYNDERVFAQFARAAVECKDIVLYTEGKTKRSYLYTSDAVSAILKIMLESEKSSIYNVANEETYCSIFEMAKLIAEKNNVKVVFNIKDSVSNLGFAPTLCMNLDCSKLKRIGWEPKINLEEMYNRLITFMKKM